MRCSNGITSSPPNPKAASPRGGRCQVPSTSPAPPSVVASHRGRHPALHRGRPQHGYLANGRPPRRALSVSTAERRGLSQFMQYLPQIPPAISPSSPPLPSSSRGAVQSARATRSKPALFFVVLPSCPSPPHGFALPIRQTAQVSSPRLHVSPTSFSCANGGLDGFAQTDGQAACSLVDPPRDTSLSPSLPQDGQPTAQLIAAHICCTLALCLWQTRLRHDGRSKNTSLGPKVAASQLGQPPLPPWVRVPPKRAPPLAQSYQRAQPARRHIDRPLQPYQNPRPHSL